jgi:Xaa-Pro aminopeptidase
VTSTVDADGVTATSSDRATIRSRVRERMREQDLAGYVAFTPSNVAYLSGFVSYFLSTWWRMHGTVMVAMATDGDLPPVLIVGDAEGEAARGASVDCDVVDYPMWVETRGYADILRDPGSEVRRPSQWRDEDIADRLAASLRGLGLTSGRVGTDLRYIPHHAFQMLQASAPDVEWVDLSDAMYDVRSVKLPFEIERLRAASELAEAGMSHAARQAGVGATVADVRSFYFEGVARASRTATRYRDLADMWVLPGMGSQAPIGAVAADAPGMRPGDLLKFDCGTTVGGYRSDHGRTFVLGEPSREAAALYQHLSTAHEHAVAAMRPGALASDVFEAADAYMHGHGYPGYRRGHFGHSVGLDSFHEEPPFLAAEDRTPLKQGMVFAVETPFYGADLGPIMLEDLVLVTADGAEFVTHLPRTLMPAGG